MKRAFQNIISTVGWSHTSPFRPTAKMKTLDIFIFLKSPYAKYHGTMFCFGLFGETKKLRYF